AELYVEKSRLLYYQAMEERGTKSGGGEGITAPDAKYFKELAIEQYKRILKEFPAYPQNDKIRFFLGHEYQELSETPDMLREYGKLTTDYPDSPLVPEAFLILGNFYFDKRDMDTAKKDYLEVVKRNDPGLAALARYTLGWIGMNAADYKDALANFEAAARAADAGVMERTNATQAQRQKLKNVRREALTDSVQPFTEVKKPEEAIAYYGELADTRNLYSAILEKLGNRYYVQQNWGPAGRIYRVLVGLTHDTERSYEFGQRFFECVSKALKAPPAKPTKDKDGKLVEPVPPPQFTADDAIALTETIARYSADWRIEKKERDAAVKEYEAYVRDISTKVQLQAQAQSDPQRKTALNAQAARAYQAYLSFFRDPAQRRGMEENYSEALAASGQHFNAGREFERVARIDKSTEKDAIHDALAEYNQALAAKQGLGRFRRVQAREGEKQLGTYYSQTYPDAKDVASAEYNVARAFYDQGDYDTAMQLFRGYVKDHPGTKESYAAANLVLDSLAQKEDFQGLSAAAKAMQADPNLPDPAFRRQIAEIGKQADFRRIGTMLADSSDNGEDPSEKLARLAEQSAGNELGEKALYTLFVTNRDKGDADKIFDTGERYLARYPQGEFAGEILTSISKLAIDQADFARAAAYYENWAKTHPRDKGAATLLERAASIREKMGDANRATVDYLALPSLPGGMGARDAALKSVLAYRAVGDWQKAASAAQRLMQAGGDGPLAHFSIGYAALKAGNGGQAKQEFQTAVAKAQAGVVQTSDDKDAAAFAGFLLTEDLKKQFDAVQFANAEDTGAIEKKVAVLQQLEGQETEVVKLGSGEWAIAALYRVGQAYKGLADFLRHAPAPASLSAEAKVQYAKLIEEKAAPIDAKAKQAFMTCVNKANDLKVLSPWVSACAAQGTRGDPPVDVQPPAPRGGRVRPPQELTAGLQKDPLNADLLIRIAQGYLSNGDPYTAELIARRAVEVDDGKSEAHTVLAFSLLKRGLIADAGDEFATAADRAPGQGKPWINLAAHQYAYGDPRKAVESLKRADNPRAVDLNGSDVHPAARRLMTDAPRLMSAAGGSGAH
ncbi:MAG TPA: tetratricopeptide repeat protein, partial [bacterium]|nr:tetratricopeptide repeat protein [bacterium]